MGVFKPDIERMKAKGDVKGLIKTLMDRDWFIRKKAVEALVEIADREAVEPFIQLLSREQDQTGILRPEEVASLMKALGHVGDERAVEPLIRALVDGAQIVRKAAAEALGNLRNPRAIEPLVQALKDQNRDVLERAVEALGKMSDVRAMEGGIECLIEIQRYEVRGVFDREIYRREANIRSGARRILKQIGKPAVEALTSALRDEDTAIRKAAALSLGDIGDERAATPLIQALKDKHKEVRREAALALRYIGDEVTENLIQALKDKDEEVKKAAVEALANRKNERAIEGLIQALKDDEILVAALAGLGKIGNSRTTEKVISTLFDRAYPIAKTWTIREDVADISRTRIRSEEEEKSRNRWKSNFRNLFADHTDLIVDAALFEVWDRHTKDGRYLGYKDYYLDSAEDATKRLCEVYSRVTSNILHVIAQRRDIKVESVETGRETVTESGILEYSTGHDMKTLSFELLRNMAKKELEQRGNPPYDSSIYLDEKAWACEYDQQLDGGQ